METKLEKRKKGGTCLIVVTTTHPAKGLVLTAVFKTPCCSKSCSSDVTVPSDHLRAHSHRVHAIAGPARPPACAMCPSEGGLLRRCAGGRWAHCTCALWTPETWLDASSGLIQGLDRVPKVCACA